MKNKKNNVISFPTDISENEREIEAILFAAEEPLDVESIESKIKKKRNILKSSSPIFRRLFAYCSAKGKWI